MNGSNKSGDGNDKTGGNKGKLNGDLNAKDYNGGGGSGNGNGGGNGSGTGLGTGSGYGNGSGSGTGTGNYQLGNRKAVSKPAPKYLCNEQGTVVVQIAVDRNGTVISANPGVKGTENERPAFFTACSMPVFPANTIKSANDIFLPFFAFALNST